MSGKKFDSEKPAVQFIPPIAILLEGRAMREGAGKYGDWNYLEGMKWSRLVGAALRHLLAWHSGETLDPETGISHLAHARCCLAMLIQYQESGIGEDDRVGTVIRSLLETSPCTPSQQSPASPEEH